MTLYTFPFCRVAVKNGARYVETQFPDGTIVPAAPRDTTEYRQRAVELGYSEDVWSMCRDHELAHTWIAFCEGHCWSPVLYRVAHDIPLVDVDLVDNEERLVIEFQSQLDKTKPRPWDTSPFVRRERFLDWPSAT